MLEQTGRGTGACAGVKAVFVVVVLGQVLPCSYLCLGYTASLNLVSAKCGDLELNPLFSGTHPSAFEEVEIKSIRKMLARVADTGHIQSRNA